MTEEKDFQTEWGANWSAFLFAFDLHDRSVMYPPAGMPGVSPTTRSSRSMTRFVEDVEILFLEDALVTRTTIPHSALQAWEDKPWRLQSSELHLHPRSFPGPESGYGFSQNTPRSFRVTPISRAISHNPWAEAPAWTQQIWDSIFVAQSEPATTREAATISHLSCSRSRHLCLGPSWWDWDSQIRSLWQDHLRGRRDYQLYVVHPEPPRAPDELHQAHVIVSQVLEPQRAALITAAYMNSYGDCQLWRQAYTLPSQVTDHEIFARVPRAWRYRAGDVSQCSVLQDEVVLSGVPRPIPHGAGIVLHHEHQRDVHSGDPFATVVVPTEDAPAENDDVHFLAMGPPRFIGYEEANDLTQDPAIAQDLDEVPPPAPDDPEEDSPAEESPESAAHSLWLSSVTYSLSRPASTGRTDWTDHDTLHRSIANNLAVSPHDLQAVYHVKHAPEDLVEHYTQVFVALLHWDQLPGELYSLVLLDVAFYQHQPLRQPAVVREARLFCPRRLLEASSCTFLVWPRTAS